MTKLNVNGGRISHCTTAFHLSGPQDASVKNMVLDNVETVLSYDNQEAGSDSSIEPTGRQPPFGLRASTSGWTRASSQNWKFAFRDRKEGSPMFSFEDVNMEKVGTFYRGPDGVELSVKRGTLNADTVIEIIVPNTVVAEGNGIRLRVPMPKDFNEGDLKSILQTISDAIKKGEDPEPRLKTNASWLRWIAAGADSATLLQALSAVGQSFG